MVKLIERELSFEEKKARIQHIERIVSEEFNNPNYVCSSGLDSFYLRNKGLKDFANSSKLTASADSTTHTIMIFVNDSGFTDLAKRVAERYKAETGYDVLVIKERKYNNSLIE